MLFFNIKSYRNRREGERLEKLNIGEKGLGWVGDKGGRDKENANRKGYVVYRRRKGRQKKRRRLHAMDSVPNRSKKILPLSLIF